MPLHTGPEMWSKNEKIVNLVNFVNLVNLVNLVNWVMFF